MEEKGREPSTTNAKTNKESGFSGKSDRSEHYIVKITSQTADQCLWGHLFSIFPGRGCGPGAYLPRVLAVRDGRQHHLD